MKEKEFVPMHLNASPDDLSGNAGIGRYILLPGSDGRAKAIAERFNDVQVKSHPRAHHLYLGTLPYQDHKIDVAAVASGMGCPSMEIILHELYHLGAKRFLRIGTAGSLQNHLKSGDIINVQGSVRDEGTTTHYMPIEVPALASVKFTSTIYHAAAQLNLLNQLHTGIVHCKSALYAREFNAGPRGREHEDYKQLLTRCGVLASEMETAALFVQTQLYNHELSQRGAAPSFRVLAGAILTIVASEKQPTDDAIHLGIETIKLLATEERSVCHA